jgi:hypothetical protein
MYELSGCRIEQRAAVVERAIMNLPMSAPEAASALAGAIGITSGLRLVRRILIGVRNERLQVCQRLLERRMSHSQRIEDVVLDILVERFT